MAIGLSRKYYAINLKQARDNMLKVAYYLNVISHIALEMLYTYLLQYYLIKYLHEM